MKNQYLTGNNLNNNQSKISNLQADIAGYTQQIQEAEQNKKVITQAVIKMRKQISDIQSGKFKFTDDVKSQKLK
ncbi:MAG: gp58-like family protein [Lactococcus lactis]|nr:gp58-like family protein [Lactococcus lactis]